MEERICGNCVHCKDLRVNQTDVIVEHFAYCEKRNNVVSKCAKPCENHEFTADMEVVTCGDLFSVDDDDIKRNY